MGLEKFGCKEKSSWLLVEPCVELDFCLTPTPQAHCLVLLSSRSGLYNVKEFFPVQLDVVSHCNELLYATD